uniref:hypothetical protein n=1 Tax=Thaumasiovibrio occultus TaxID=1891184 RepID=UPI000B3544EB|nr:hypothetical protein [Thaumasiovibrio occultus]
MIKEIFAFAAMVLLQGCAQPTLRYQPPEGTTEKYYANVALHIAADTEDNGFKRGVLTSQLTVSPEASSSLPSLRVNLERLQFDMTDSEYNVSQFDSLTDEEQILVDHQQTGTVLSQRADGGHDVVSNSHFPLDKPPFTVVSQILDKLNPYELVALLPPKIELKSGAMLNVQQGRLQLQYEVIALTSERVTLSVKSSFLTGLVAGWVEYDVSTGVLKDARIFYRFYRGTHVKAFIALHQHNDALPTYVYYKDEFLKLFLDTEMNYLEQFSEGDVNVWEQHWPIYEKMNRSSTRVLENANEEDLDIKVFNTDDPLFPIQVRIYDESLRPKLAKLHEVSIDDMQGNRVNSLEYSESVYASRDEWGSYTALNLHLDEPFDKGMVNLTYTAIRDREVKFVNVPLNAGAGFYQEDGFQISVEQVAERTWQLHVNKESNALKARLEPQLRWGVNYPVEHIESVRYVYPSEPITFEADGIPSSVAYSLNRDFSSLVEVTFTEEITQDINLYLEYFIPTELHYRMPTEALVGSVAEYPPVERLVGGKHSMAKENPFTPLVNARLSYIVVDIPRILNGECDIKNISISDVGAWGWALSEVQRPGKLNHISYMSNADYSTWEGHSDEIEVEVHCPEYRATELVPQQDYIQLKPWLITLTGELASLSANQMLEELRVFNEEGKEIHWVIPEPDADFSFPTMKAWGSIARIVHISKTGEEVIYRHRPDFTEYMHPMERK